MSLRSVLVMRVLGTGGAVRGVCGWLRRQEAAAQQLTTEPGSLVISWYYGIALHDKRWSGSQEFQFKFDDLHDNFRDCHSTLLADIYFAFGRTTTVHSTPIPAKDQKSSQVPQRIPTGRPGRVVGPVIPFENSCAMDPYSQRRVARNPVLPAAATNVSAYTYHRKSDNSERELQQELEKDRMQYQPMQRFMDAKMVSPDLRSTSYYMPKGVPKADVAERTGLQPNMMQGIAPFNGIAAVGGSSGGPRMRACSPEPLGAAADEAGTARCGGGGRIRGRRRRSSDAGALAGAAGSSGGRGQDSGAADRVIVEL